MIGQALRELELDHDQSLLDVGCGDSLSLDRIWRSFGSAGVGVDISQGSLRRGRNETISNTRASQADAYRLPFPANTFDVVISFDVLEHIESPGKVVRELFRVLRPGGRVVCYVVGSNNRLTLNWFITLLLEKLGDDPWRRTAHKPELLVDPNWLRDNSTECGFSGTSVQPYHAFFTIGFDQAMLACAWIAGRVFPARAKGRTWARLARAWVEIASTLGRSVRPFAEWLDRPWTSRGLSNGYLLVASKPTIMEDADAFVIDVQHSMAGMEIIP